MPYIAPEYTPEFEAWFATTRYGEAMKKEDPRVGCLLQGIKEAVWDGWVAGRASK
jgi:hypothetical protein